MASGFEFNRQGQAIAFAFADQRLSPRAGGALFWGGLRPLDGATRLTAALPHRFPTSHHKLLPLETALAFMQGWLGDARKLTHLADLRRDPLAPEPLGIKRIARQSALTRFYSGLLRGGWRQLWDPIPSPFPNCPAVENRPVFRGSIRIKHHLPLHRSG